MVIECIKWLKNKIEEELNVGNYKHAIIYLEKLLGLGRNNKRLILYANKRLGEVYFELEIFSKASECFKNIVTLNEKEHQSYYYLGLISAISGEWGKSVHEFKKALDILPNDPEYMRGLGISYANLGNQAVGESILKEAMRIDPHNIEILYDLVVCLIHNGKYYESLKLITTILNKEQKEKSNDTEKIDKLHVLYDDLLLWKKILAKTIKRRLWDEWYTEATGRKITHFGKFEERFHSFPNMFADDSDPLSVSYLINSDWVQEEYTEYLKEHRVLGKNRKKLSRKEFVQLDKELWDLDAMVAADIPLTREQRKRKMELECLLLIDL
ncbi:MAG: tetratricopeptide repeat protein [Thermodesulfobacteriota bacterium]|nr:tetratricopeptide repeat protein [Thermodesulfobacteriota bacterium]